MVELVVVDWIVLCVVACSVSGGEIVTPQTIAANADIIPTITFFLDIFFFEKKE